MICYKDKTFCPKSDAKNPKCVECDRFFDKNAYEKNCKERGFKMPISWFLKPPCGDTDTENFIVNFKEGQNDRA